MEINANPEKSDRPVDSHKEWAQTIQDMDSRDVHLDLLVASWPLRLSETRANDPLGFSLFQVPVGLKFIFRDHNAIFRAASWNGTYLG